MRGFDRTLRLAMDGGAPACGPPREPSPHAIFVFGSDVAGRHDCGAAAAARDHHGAQCGQGLGRQGASYGIPTRNADLRPLPLWEIAAHVVSFLDYARAHPELTFRLTAIGCGLAGYEPGQIARMFATAPCNVMKPPEFEEALS